MQLSFTSANCGGAASLTGPPWLCIQQFDARVSRLYTCMDKFGCPETHWWLPTLAVAYPRRPCKWMQASKVYMDSPCCDLTSKLACITILSCEPHVGRPYSSDYCLASRTMLTESSNRAYLFTVNSYLECVVQSPGSGPLRVKCMTVGLLRDTMQAPG